MQMKDDTSYDEVISSLIEKAEIPIKAILGNSTISVNDFASLQRGDIIRLDKKTDDELSIYVGNIYKFTALPGATENKYAVKVTSVVREEK